MKTKEGREGYIFIRNNGLGESTFEHVREVMAKEQSHPPSHNIRKRKKKKKPKNRKQKTHHHKGNKETRQPQITKEISFLKLKF